MKKILISLSLALTSFAFAEQVDWETFQQRIFKEYPSVEYVAYSTYERWNGDAEKLISYLKENGQCLAVEDDTLIGDADVRSNDSN